MKKKKLIPRKQLNANVVFEKYIININSNGLISIPKKIREGLGLTNDSKFPILFSGNQLIINAESTPSLVERARRLQKKIKSSTEGIKYRSYQEAKDSLSNNEILMEIGGMI